MSLRKAVASTSRAVFTLSRTLPPCTCIHLRHASPPLAAASPAQSLRQYASFPSRQNAGSKRSFPQFARDDAIRSRWVRLVLDDSEGGGLGPIEAKSRILKGIERRETCLQQVDTQEMTQAERNEVGDPKGTIAICKLVDRKEARLASVAKEAAAKERRKAKAEEKEVQLTWGVSVNDLGHKLKKARQVIDKGGRVTLVISAPKGSKLPSRPEREAFVGMLKSHLGLGTDACRVWKEDEWRGSKTSAFLAGTTKPNISTEQAASPQAEQAAS